MISEEQQKPYVWQTIVCAVLTAVLFFGAAAQAAVYSDPAFRRYYKRDRPVRALPDPLAEVMKKNCAQIIEQHERELPSQISYGQKDETPEIRCREDGKCAFRKMFEAKKLKFRGFLKDQLLEDVYREYYSTGEMKFEISYQAGKRNGSSKFFYEIGGPRTEKTYKDGILDGPFRGFYANRQLRVEAEFQNGRLQGPARAFYDDGHLMREETYVDDRVEGLVRVFYNDGVLRGEYRFQGGKLDAVLREFYPDGTLKEGGRNAGDEPGR